jgi:hypothetical protein
MNKKGRFLDSLTASGYEQKALVAQPADTCPGTLGRNCPGGLATMAQFLQVPAKDKIVSVAGFVQSRSLGFGRRVISQV